MVKLVMGILVVIGLVANIYKKRWCFLVWMIANVFWLHYNYCIGEYIQAGLFLAYFLSCCYGFWKWRNDAA